MSALEKTIEDTVVREAKKRYGVHSVKFTPEGSTGYPDRIFFISGGRPLFIEFKRPGEKPRVKQLEIHKAMRRLGYTVAVHDCAANALRDIEHAETMAQQFGEWDGKFR